MVPPDQAVFQSRGAVLGWLVTAGAVLSPESAEAET